MDPSTTSSGTDPLDDVDAIALLDEPVRRALYAWVAVQPQPVGRDQAAVGVGISRALAAFHLDRLADAGLLTTEFRRLSGKSGPGAGRPAKLYRRADREVAVSLPPRRYDIAAALMADTLDGADGDPRTQRRAAALRDAARRMGQAVGAVARAAAGRRPSLTRRRAALLATLTERGYEPHVDGAEVRLGNCPFDALVDDHRDLVCGMNLGLAEGILDGLGDDRASARIDRRPGLCCVAFDLG